MSRPKCLRPNCPNRVHRNKLCTKHNRAAPHGYRPAETARQHLERLSARIDQTMIAEMTGLSEVTLRNIRDGRYEQSKFHAWASLMRIEIPGRPVAGTGILPAQGTARRIQALAVMGWPQTVIADRTGFKQVQSINRMLRSSWVSSRNAAKIAALFDELHMVPGPSELARGRALGRGWLSPLAWDLDTIDDPAAEPNIGTVRRVSFLDRYREVRHHVGLSHPEQIAKALGITTDSLQRQIERHRQELAS